MGEYCFILDFQRHSDKEKVLIGRPWFFYRDLLALQEFEGSTAPNAIFLSEPFWVQLHKLPLEGMSKEIGGKTGSAIGNVFSVDVDGEGLAWEKSLQVRVKVELSKPLLLGMWVRVGEKQLWISFKYERMENFCFKCEVLKHKGGGCTRHKLDGKMAEESQAQYGLWLRGKPSSAYEFQYFW